VVRRLPPQGDAEGPDLHLLQSTASSKVPTQPHLPRSWRTQSTSTAPHTAAGSPQPAAPPSQTPSTAAPVASPTATTSHHAGPTATRRSGTPRPGNLPALLTLTLTEPFPPLQGRQITAFAQDQCGDPTRALVYVDVADPTSISTVWYEYHVQTSVPFNGENHSPSVLGGDFRTWRGMIGPFDADPRNAAGGPIVVTAHGTYKDGTVRSVTATWTLLPCKR
jgi:hypothetical protein